MSAPTGTLRPTLAAAATGVVLGLLAAAFDDVRLPSTPDHAGVTQSAAPHR